jgi:hypothetical protein
MTTRKISDQRQKAEPIPAHPLAGIAGKFSGQAWLDTLAEMENFRKTEKDEINESLNHRFDQ